MIKIRLAFLILVIFTTPVAAVLCMIDLYDGLTVSFAFACYMALGFVLACWVNALERIVKILEFRLRQKMRPKVKF